MGWGDQPSGTSGEAGETPEALKRTKSMLKKAPSCQLRANGS